jgi:hypothetical protein
MDVHERNSTHIDLSKQEYTSAQSFHSTDMQNQITLHFDREWITLKDILHLQTLDANSLSTSQIIIMAQYQEWIHLCANIINKFDKVK